MASLFRPLPSLERNPFANGTDPRNTFTLILPDDCMETINRDGVTLSSETRRWLNENIPNYACRVLEAMWLTAELKAVLKAKPLGTRQIMPFITFENENDALLFKLRWS